MKILEMPLINCEITLNLNWSENCVIVSTNAAAQVTTFSITDTKLYASVVTLSTQDNANLPEQLKFGFKRAINWNKYQTEVSTERVNRYLDFLINPSFQGVSRLLLLPFENEAQWTSYKRYCLPTREIKNYNVIDDGQNVFDQPIRNNLITYDIIQKIGTGQEDDYTTGCLLDYNCFKRYYQMIAIHLSKQQALDADPKAIQEINFTRNLEQQATFFILYWKVKETVSDFSEGTVNIF